jgi:3-hydroxyisobutyrate dehydrogenase
MINTGGHGRRSGVGQSARGVGEAMRVTVLGTGIMGTGVAGSLIREGHDVTVWNRDTGKAKPLGDAGATVADSPAAAVAGAEAVLTVLFDTDAVLEVMTKAVGSLARSAVWAQLSTIGLDGSAKTAEFAEQHGVSLVEAMMLGTKAPAENGELVLLIGGDPALVNRLSPVFDAISSRVVNTGDRIGPASALKLSANAWVGSITALVGQSMALTKALGLDPQLFLDAIKGGAVDTPYAHVKGKSILAGEYPPSFPVAGIIKDLGLIRAAAQRAGMADDLLAAVEARFVAASELGHGSDDMAAVYTTFLPKS